MTDDDSELKLTTDNPLIGPLVLPFGALDRLAEPPVKLKLRGDVEHQNVIALLANLDIRAEPQQGDPFPAAEMFGRGDPDAATSFLPLGQDVEFGLGAATIQIFANDIWHGTLRADDGSHPLPNADERFFKRKSAFWASFMPRRGVPSTSFSTMRGS